MNNELFVVISENLIQLVFAVISVLFASIILPWIKSDVIPWLKEKRLFGVVSKYVKAAEKLGEDNKDFNKKEYVISLLKNNGIEVTTSVDALIETAVKELDITVQQAASQIVEIIDSEQLEKK